MNSLLRSIIAVLLLFSYCTAFSQPDLTLWRLEESVHEHTQHDDDLTEFYDCGSRYYAIIRDTEAEHITTWSIKNEGDAELVFDLPLHFTGASERFTIVEQPAVNVLQPNEEVLFKVEYEGIESASYAFLILNSNDPAEQSCAYAFDAGSVVASTACTCDGNNEVLDIFTKQIGGSTGILIGSTVSGIACPPEGTDCQPMSITDPTDCSQLTTTTGGADVFQDVLTINAVPGLTCFALIANNTADGFLDPDGMAYPALANGFTLFIKQGLFDNQSPGPDGVIATTLVEVSPGVYQIPFLRAPGSSVDISLNGTPFMSASAAPTVASCTQVVPTLSEWGMIVLALLLMIFGLAAIRQSKKAVTFS